MKADLDDFGTGWFGVQLGLKASEIDALIATLKVLKEEKSHFHYRSEFEGAGGIGDIEIYFQSDENSTNMELEPSVRSSKPE